MQVEQSTSVGAARALLKPRCPAPPRSRCGSAAGHEQLRDCLHLTTMTTSCKHKKASLCIRVLSSAMPRCGPPVCAEVHVVYEAGGRSPPTCHATRAGPSSTRRRGKGGRRWPRHAARVGDRVVWWVITNQCSMLIIESFGSGSRTSPSGTLDFQQLLVAQEAVHSDSALHFLRNLRWRS